MIELQSTIEDMVDTTRGILAADESAPTIAKRFSAIETESTEAQRQNYRSLLLTTPGLGEFISGVILFEETLDQINPSGQKLPDVAWSQGIVPGIKVDKGTGPLAASQGDMITYGLDGLESRLESYKQKGARFAKWREIYPISAHNPASIGLSANAEMLARYAATCQKIGIVPIVEPEVLMDGDHDIHRCADVIEHVLHSVFHALHLHNVTLEHMILKPSMVTPGKGLASRAPSHEVAEATLKVLRRTVPAAVPSINFLSGGQSPEEATENLNALNQLREHAPWQLSTSYGRALQQPVLQAWKGDAGNIDLAQAALLKRARLNSIARQGEYNIDLERT